MEHIKKIIAGGLVAVLATIGLASCATDADTVSYNLSQQAEQFNIERRITAINGITGDNMLIVEGRCSIESGETTGVANALEITCMIGANQYVKHFVGLSDNVSYITQQLGTADASRYHHLVLIKPENLLPEFDYEAGEQ